MLSREISLRRSPKFGICSRHFETNAQRPGRARPLSVTSCRSRDFVLERVFVLEVMADLQPYHFEPERVPNPEDREKRKRRSKRLVRRYILVYLWEMWNHSNAKRMTCVCCREQPEAENKMEGRILCLYCIGCSKWKNSFLCKLL